MTVQRRGLAKWAGIAAAAATVAGLGLNWWNKAEERERVERAQAIAEAKRAAKLEQKVDRIAEDISEIKDTLNIIAPRRTLPTASGAGRTALR